MTRRALPALMATILLAGCAPVVAITEQAVHSNPSTALEAPAEWSGRVLAVLDGDTLDVDHDGHRVRVRLLGIDAPEIAHTGKPAGCGGDAAKAYLDQRVRHHSITVATDATADHIDRYGRTLAYVYLGQADIGLDAVTHGYAEAWHPASSPTPSRQRTYQLAQQKAQQQRRGSWATCPTLGRQSRDL